MAVTHKIDMRGRCPEDAPESLISEHVVRRGNCDVYIRLYGNVVAGKGIPERATIDTPYGPKSVRLDKALCIIRGWI